MRAPAGTLAAFLAAALLAPGVARPADPVLREAAPAGTAPPAPERAEGDPATAAAPATGDDLWVPGNKRPLSRERWQAPARVPVRFDGKVLFHVRGGVGEITPADRARKNEARLRAIASADAPVGPAKVKDGEFSDVFLGDRFVASIADVDADASGPARAG